LVTLALNRARREFWYCGGAVMIAGLGSWSRSDMRQRESSEGKKRSARGWIVDRPTYVGGGCCGGESESGESESGESESGGELRVRVEVS
jgi:hypothetical protein